MVNVETNHGAFGVEVDIEAVGDLPGLDARRAPKLDSDRQSVFKET